MVTSDSLIGRQIGNYRLLAKIGGGSFCSVYLGRHIIFEDEPAVAIKLLHTVLQSQQEHSEFINEAQLLKKLRHRHILQILDAGLQGSIPYLVTEYATGGSLRERLRNYNGQPLPIVEALTILTQIGEALQYAHQQRVVHRDLKPENILFNGQGEVLLADFGIAVLLESTRTGQVGFSGTPSYMAPEQFEGLASTKSDQYALGCIAYELVTGRRLFTIPNPTLEAYWYHHAKVDPVPPTRYNPHLPASIEQAILLALAKERFNRYRDVAALIESLTEIGEDEDYDDFIDDNWDTGEFYKASLLDCERAILLRPDDAALYREKALNLTKLERYKEALDAYNQAIRLDPTHATTFSQQAAVLWHLKRYEEALAACNRAIYLDPNDGKGNYNYRNKGMLLADLKRYEEALVVLDQAIRLHPHHALAHRYKGSVLTSLKRYEEALAAYNEAILLELGAVFVYQEKAKVLRYLGRYQEAEEAEIEAIDNSVENAIENMY